MSVDTFGIEKEFLRTLLDDVAEGSAQLPEFQRGWVWPERNIASLLASISQGYPVGTVMMLRTGGPVRFKQRPVEGAEAAPGVQPERLILDGQQRLTSLFQALRFNAPVNTQDSRRREVSGWFYIDMRAALDPHADREEAIHFVPEERVVLNFRREPVLDVSTREKEYHAHFFPLHHALDPQEWWMGWQEYWDYDRKKIMLWNDFQKRVINHFATYQLPIIELGRATPREAVCQVFEKVNTGGVTLTVFELLTATYAADEFDLREDWDLCRHEWEGPKHRILREVSNTDFLQAVTLLATRARREAAAAQGVDDEERLPRVGCKRTDMLGLTLPEYRRFSPHIVAGLKSTARFLHQQYLFETRFLPYGTQLIPLSAIFAVLGQEAENAGAQQKIAQVFWCGVFGELYGGSTETRFSRDLPEVVVWVRGDDTLPRTVYEAEFASSRLHTLRTRGSAAYKGIYALLLKEGALDWRTGAPSTVDTYFDEAVDIHHILPKHWCDQEGIDPKTYNSIVNKTPLSARTNRIIGSKGPSEYLPGLARSAKIDASTLDKYVSTHLCDPDLMRADDFQRFHAAREDALLSRISTAMGKAITETAVDYGDTLESDDDTDDL
jgi:hypothetical protein